VKATIYNMINHFTVTEEQRIDLYKLIVAQSDIGEALITTKYFIETVKDMSDPKFLSLQDTIVILYSRPFKRSKPYGKLPDKWGNFNVKEYQNLHEMLLNHRDKVVAHSDYEKKKVQIIPKGCTTIKGMEPSSDINFTVSSIKLPIKLFPKIEQLCFDLGSRLEFEARNKLNELYGSFELPKSPFDLI